MTQDNLPPDNTLHPAQNAGLQATNAGLIRTVQGWHRDGHGVALAMVMQTWGSSPRPVGSVMVIRDDMAVEGSVSGGCVEGAVIDAGLDSIASGAGRRLDFGVADARAWEVGLSCGGRIAVLVTPVAEGGLPPRALAALDADIRSRRQVTLCFDAVSGALQTGVANSGDAISCLSEDESRFTFSQQPPRRLLIVGGVHITQFLAPMAQQAGYDVTIIDPRAVFAAADRFPGTRCLAVWPDEAMADLVPDDRTAVVTLTHDPKIDDPGLRTALQGDAFYIGCLGSRRTHAARCERLAEAGFAPEAIARLHGPAGMDIGAKTPAEIAVSILAELIAVERKGGVS
ncbi:MAG: XdhC family protein [Candidatus Puniceispirillaceae bacterium]